MEGRLSVKTWVGHVHLKRARTTRVNAELTPERSGMRGIGGLSARPLLRLPNGAERQERMLKRPIPSSSNAEDHSESLADHAKFSLLERDARTELGRFFLAAQQLHANRNEPAFMPACFIDTFWHRVLGDRATYDVWTTKLVGEKIEHVPDPGEGMLSWVPIYEHHFGTLPSIWFTNTQGVVDHIAYYAYRRTGKTYASWECRMHGISQDELNAGTR